MGMKVSPPYPIVDGLLRGELKRKKASEQKWRETAFRQVPCPAKRTPPRRRLCALEATEKKCLQQSSI